MNLLEAIEDADFLGPAFAGRHETSRAWMTYYRALFGLPIPPAELETFRRCTGRTRPPTVPARESHVIVGRRGGKSFHLATAAVFLAGLRDYRAVLAPGERGTLPVIACDRRQARTLLRYVKGLFASSPALSTLVEKETREGVELTNRVTIEIHTGAFKSVKGYTMIGALLDELAFFPVGDSANPDVELCNALRPAMATIPGAPLIGLSSPYWRRGVLWEMYRKHWGKDDSTTLIWKAPTRTMNPTVPQELIDAALAEDEAAARAEWYAEFRSDLEAFVAREVIDACTIPGRHELPPVSDRQFVGFVDPSGGSADAFTLAIAHREGERVVLDVLRERRPPFSPSEVVAEYAALLKSYRVSRVGGDRYAGEWPREQFRHHGVEYQPAEHTKSDLYAALLPALNSHRVELLDVPRLHAQLLSLERRTARGGRDSIDHPSRGHDDAANAAAGVLVAAIGPAEPAFLRFLTNYPALGEAPAGATPAPEPASQWAGRPVVAPPKPSRAEQMARYDALVRRAWG